MANYNGMVRTNYFRIKNEKDFMDAVNGLSGEDEILTQVKTVDGNLYGWFGSCGSIDYCVDEENCEYNIDEFITKMQSVIADDDAMLITEVGSEKLRYLVGVCTIVTTKDVKFVDLGYTSIDIAREMLGNKNWETENAY